MADLSNYNVPQDGHPVHLVDSPFGPLAVMFTDIGRISICSPAIRAENHSVVNKIPVVFTIWARYDRVLATEGGRRWTVELGYASRTDKRGGIGDDLTSNQRTKIYEWARDFVPGFAAEHRATDERAVALKRLNIKVDDLTDAIEEMMDRRRGLQKLRHEIHDSGVTPELAATYTTLTK